MSWWPFRSRPVLETRRKLVFFPQPDITPFEVAKIIQAWDCVGEELNLSAADLAACIPDGCGRHFSMKEMNYERRGANRRWLSTNPCYIMRNDETKWVKPTVPGGQSWRLDDFDFSKAPGDGT